MTNYILWPINANCQTFWSYNETFSIFLITSMTIRTINFPFHWQPLTLKVLTVIQINLVSSSSAGIRTSSVTFIIKSLISDLVPTNVSEKIPWLKNKETTTMLLGHLCPCLISFTVTLYNLEWREVRISVLAEGKFTEQFSSFITYKCIAPPCVVYSLRKSDNKMKSM